MYNDMIDGDQFHSDDVHEGELVFKTTNSPHYVSIDYEAAAERNLGYLRERIEREKAYQQRQQ